METIAGLGCFRQPDNRVGCQGFFVADTEPVIRSVCIMKIRKICLLTVADIEEIAKHSHFIPLLALPEERRYGYTEELSE